MGAANGSVPLGILGGALLLAALGFAAMGITQPDAVPQQAERLAEFLRAGRHGQMGWMAERTHWRGDPAACRI